MIATYEQLSLLPNVANVHKGPVVVPNDANAIKAEDRAIHDWYRFVLSYPPHLVRDYLEDFGLEPGSTVLDPFCGTGTTVVEAKLNHMRGIGLEANPFPQFASSVKIDWSVNPDQLLAMSAQIADRALAVLATQGIDDWRAQTPNNIDLWTLDAETQSLLIAGSISPLPLHKTLVLLDALRAHEGAPGYRHSLLALGNALVNAIGNLRFGPEVGVGKKKEDTPVIAAWLAEVRRIAADLRTVYGRPYPDSVVHLADARRLGEVVAPCSVDAVITSPPYPNEKDYTRTTRLETVVLGFITSRAQLRALKQMLIRSNTRGVYQTDQDDRWIAEHTAIQDLAAAIENRRVEMGKTSGFERLYPRVTKLYFGGMARHLAELRTILRPGAMLAYVVGDQASYLRVMIRTGQLLAEIAERLGYQVVRIDLFRTRFATATQSDLREEVVVLRWPGD